MSNYKWQGEPVEVEFGYCVVFENKENPMYWYNYLVAISPESCSDGKFATIPAIKVITDHYEFVIANHHAYGIHKLELGGWPNHGHSSLPIDSFTKSDNFKFTEFDSKGFSNFDKSKDNWFAKNHPEEFKRMEDLRNLINRK